MNWKELNTIRTVDGSTGLPSVIHTVVYSRDGQYCLTGSADRTIKLWNPRKDTFIKTYAEHGKDVLGIALPLNDNSRFASCGMDRSVLVWDVSTGRVVRRFNDHSQRVNAIDFNADASVVASVSYDATMRLWDCRSQSRRPIQVVAAGKDSVESIQINGHEILTGCTDGFIRIFDVRMGCVTQDSIGSPVTCTRFSNDKNCVLAVSLDNSIRLVDKESGELLNSYSGHSNAHYRVMATMSYTDAHVIGGSEDGSVFMWDLVDASISSQFKAHSKSVTCIAYHPKSHEIITVSLDGLIKLWKQLTL